MKARVKRRDIGVVAIATAIAVSLLAPGSSLAKGGTIDFGDAPDGRKAGYGGAPKVAGKFPSVAATPGPRHTPIGGLRLGKGVDGEGNSHQVDRDLFDDGAEATLRNCGASTLEVALNGAALPAATRTSAHTAYVNAWFDWNRDGDWADPSDGCRAEWAIQNLPVDMSVLASSGFALLPISFTAGKRTQDMWWRVTLTLDQPVVDPTSKGPPIPYVQGETEDYRIGTYRPPVFDGDDDGGGGGGKKKDKFTVSCVSNPALILHGGTAKVRFAIKDGKGFIFGAVAKLPGKKTGKFKLIPKKPQPKGVPPGFKAMDGFSFKSSEVDPPTRIQVLKFKFVFRRGNRVQRLTCTILVLHIGKIPFFNCGVPAGCAGVIAARPPVGAPTLNSGWTEFMTEIVQLQLNSAQPVTQFKLPLLSQQPPWTGASLIGTNDGVVNCLLGTIRPDGGPAALVCNRPSVAVNNLYGIATGVALPSAGPLLGEITINGQELSFTAQNP
jgi:hypothetical protein